MVVTGDESQGYKGEAKSAAVKVAEKEKTAVTNVEVKNKVEGQEIKLNSVLLSKTTPEDAKVTYKWQVADTDTDGDFKDISGATEKEFTITSEEEGKYVRVVVTGDESQGYKGEVKSAAVKVAAKEN